MKFCNYTNFDALFPYVVIDIEWSSVWSEVYIGSYKIARPCSSICNHKFNLNTAHEVKLPLFLSKTCR